MVNDLADILDLANLSLEERMDSNGLEETRGESEKLLAKLEARVERLKLMLPTVDYDMHQECILVLRRLLAAAQPESLS